MSLAPKPSYRRWNRAEQIQIAMDEPFTFGKAFGENIVQGALDSFGLGTAIKEVTTPPLADTRPQGSFEDALRGGADADVMTEEAYKASPYYRKEVPWEQGMTEDRAAALAKMYDTKQVRAHFSAKQPIAAFLGGFVGQAFDPINYIPVFSGAAYTAAVAKFGSIGGRVLMGASEAAINTAAFGVLTAGIREKYGDDVSFAGIVNEVAVSALIGGVFGSGIGLLARGGDARRRLQQAKVRDQLDTLKTTQQAMIPLGEAATRLAAEGEVRLSPNGMSIIERARAESATRDVTGRALETETAGVVGTRAGEVVVTPSGFKVNVRPEVVELDSLIPATGALQVRNRSTAASAAQVEQIATGLDPARLMPNISADQGAPLVGDDNIIDSGNGRVMAIRRAYEAYPERAEAYRQALADAGYDVSAMQNPVLVQRRVTPLSPDARSQFNADANSSSTARMSAVEIAEMDRAALTDGVLDVLDDGPIAAAGNRAAVARFIANLPPNERGALVDKAGNLSADGARRIENALVASAYADVDAGVLRRFAEATDDNTRSIVGAMADVAGRWARMRRAIGAGEVSPEFDTTPELTGALRALGGWRDQAAREGRPVSVVIREGMAQMDLLGGELSPEAQIFVRMFYKTDQFSQVVGRDALTARLDRVIESTMELGKPQLFADAIPTKAEVIRNATDGLEADLFAPDSVVGRAQEDGQSGEPARAGAAGEANRPGTGTGDEGQRVAAAKAELDEARATFDAMDSRAKFNGDGEAEKYFELSGALSDAKEKLAAALSEMPGAVVLRHHRDEKRGAMVTRSMDAGAEWRVTYFDERGFSGDAPRKDKITAMNEAVGDGFEVLSPNMLREFSKLPSFAEGNEATEIIRRMNVESAKRSQQEAPAVDRVKAAADLIASQPARTLDELYAVAPAHQKTLGEVGAELGTKYGAEWKDPGIKKQATSAEKMERKRYDSTRRLTDVVRGGFTVKDPGQADAIVADLAKRFTVVDEGWRITAAGYFDRKAMVQFEDGTIAEVQFWHPEMLEVKEGRGHSLYEEMRLLPDGDPRYLDLLDQQRDIYLATLDKVGDEWLPIVSQLSDELVAMSGRPIPGKAASNSASVSGRPESMTSSNRTVSQPPPSETMAQAELPDMIAGLASQSKNVGSMIDNMAMGMPPVNGAEPRPEPPIDGLDEAAARVGTGEDMKALAAQFGVDEAGGFAEQADIDRLKELGRLTPEEIEALEIADQQYDDAVQYGEMLQYIAATCGVRG